VRTSGGTNEIPIWDCETIQNGVECRIACPRENLDGKGTRLERISGLVFLTEGGAFFGTEWDDQPIVQEEFLERLKHPDVKENSGDARQDELENSSEKVQRNTETSSQNVQKASDQSGPDRESESIAQCEPDLKTQEFAPDPRPEIPPASPSGFRPGNAAEAHPGDRPDTIPGPSPTSRPGTPSGSPPDSRPGTPPGSSANPRPETTPGTPSAPVPAPQLPGEPFDPFSDGAICDCRKIQLRDLRCLKPGDSGLRNNRFLMHGYQNFGYLLLGRTPGGQYILGVPGGYDQQERFMAGMFGFPYFKDSTQIRLPDGRGGFWYRLINAPDCSMENRS
jgi:hypothetical protein